MWNSVMAKHVSTSLIRVFKRLRKALSERPGGLALRPSEFELFGVALPESDRTSEAEMLGLLRQSIKAADAGSLTAEDEAQPIQPVAELVVREVKFILSALQSCVRPAIGTLGAMSTLLQRRVDFPDSKWSEMFPWITYLTVEGEDSRAPAEAEAFLKVRAHLKPDRSPTPSDDVYTLRVTITDDRGNADSVVLSQAHRLGRLIHRSFPNHADKLVVMLSATGRLQTGQVPASE
jgi:hypothetical protein